MDTGNCSPQILEAIFLVRTGGSRTDPNDEITGIMLCYAVLLLHYCNLVVTELEFIPPLVVTRSPWNVHKELVVTQLVPMTGCKTVSRDFCILRTVYGLPCPPLVVTFPWMYKELIVTFPWVAYKGLVDQLEHEYN
jgi:hypothetical protein